MRFSELIYRTAVVAYPADYRSQRGDEVVGTLLDATDGRRLPDLRELASIAVDGYRRRVRAASAPRWGTAQASALWAAHALAVVTAAVAVVGLMREDHLATSLPPALAPDVHVLGLAVGFWFAAFAATAVATLVALAASAWRTALTLSIAGALVQAWEAMLGPAAGFPGAHGHFAVYAWTDVSTLPREPWHWLAASLVLVACIALSRPRPVPSRAATALRIATSLALVASLAIAMDHAFGVAAALIVVLVPLVVIALAVSPADPRPALACIPLLVAALPLAWTYVHADPTTPASGGNAVLAGIPFAAAALAFVASVSVRRLRGGAPPPG